jgi:hypothetical protein
MLTHVPDAEFVIVQNLFGNSCTTYRKRYAQPNAASLDLTFGEDHDSIVQLLSVEAASKKFAKVSIVVAAEFVKVDPAGIVSDSITIHLRASQFTITAYQNHIEHVERAHSEIISNMDDFVQRGSSWILARIHFTQVECARCRPLYGSCGQLSIEYRSATETLRRAPLSAGPRTLDDRCFYYAVARHFTQSDCMETAADFVRNVLVTEGLSVPFQVRNIAKFEALNDHLDFKVNVLYKEDDGEGAQYIYPIFASREALRTHHINILLYKVLVDGVAVPHYSYLADVSKFLRREYRDKNNKLCYEHSHICPNCLCKFSSEPCKEKHFKLCSENKVQAIKMPQKGEFLQFKNYVKKFRVPLIGFFDFESNMRKVTNPCSICVSMDMCYHKTLTECDQVAGTFCLIIVDYLGKVVHQRTYSGEDCCAKFIDELLDIEPKVTEMLSTPEPMRLTQSEERSFQISNICHICGDYFTSFNYKVRGECFSDKL